jgi:hypothetical protein
VVFGDPEAIIPILRSLAEADVDIAGPDRGIGISLDLGIAIAGDGIGVDEDDGMVGGFQVAWVGLGGVVEGGAGAADLEVDDDLGLLDEEYALAVADVAEILEE